jgi:hypothetical protein
VSSRGNRSLIFPKAVNKFLAENRLRGENK